MNKRCLEHLLVQHFNSYGSYENCKVGAQIG